MQKDNNKIIDHVEIVNTPPLHLHYHHQPHQPTISRIKI